MYLPGYNSVTTTLIFSFPHVYPKLMVTGSDQSCLYPHSGRMLMPGNVQYVTPSWHCPNPAVSFMCKGRGYCQPLLASVNFLSICGFSVLRNQTFSFTVNDNNVPLADGYNWVCLYIIAKTFTVVLGGIDMFIKVVLNSGMPRNLPKPHNLLVRVRPWVSYSREARLLTTP